MARDLVGTGERREVRRPGGEWPQVSGSPTLKERSSYLELRDFNPLDPAEDLNYQRLLSTLRLEPFFRVLPETRSTAPALYDAVREKIAKFVSEGSLTLYPPGTNIHDPERGKPGQMQVVMAGELQMTLDRGWKKDNLLKQMGFRGPTYERGEALASWAMAGNTGSHYADIAAIGPVLTFALSSQQYAELIMITIHEPTVSREIAPISSEDVDALKAAKFVKPYSGEDEADLLVVMRPRDFSKQPTEESATARWKQAMQVWDDNAHLIQADFLHRTDGGWRMVSHQIQAAIKRATIAQHVLQKNFLYDLNDIRDLEPAKLPPPFRVLLSNDEMRALARNCSRISPGTYEAAGQLFLAVYKTGDVERPEKPLKNHVMDTSSQLRITVVRPDAKEYQTFTIPFPRSGVVDPRSLAVELPLKLGLPKGVSIHSVELPNNEEIDFYRIHCSQYRETLAASYEFSFSRCLADMINLGYIMTDEVRQRLEARFESAAKVLQELVGEHTSLSMNAHRELVAVMDGWIARDAQDRRGPGTITVDEAKANEVVRLFELCEREAKAKSPDRRSNDTSVPSPLGKVDPIEQKLAIIVSERFSPETLRLLTQEAIAGLYYKDAKYAFSHRVDDALRSRHVAHFSLKEFRVPYEVGWIRDHGRALIVTPDRHENLWGMHHELKALGIMSASGTLQIERLRGKHHLFLGDVINRRVSLLGYGTLSLVDTIINAARQHNERVKERPEDTIEVSMILGNHELDLIRLDEASLREMFPDVSHYLVARTTREKILDMIKEGKILAAVYLGNSDPNAPPERHAVATHSGMVPEFRDAVIGLLQDNGLPIDDQTLVKYLNQELQRAAISGNFDHIMFAKSKLRGGGHHMSGCFEADMGRSPRSDLTQAITRLKEQNSKLTSEELLELIQMKMGRQLVGHSFSTDQPFMRIFESEAIKIPGCLIADSGDHQNFTPDPMDTFSTLVIADGSWEGLSVAGHEGVFAQVMVPVFGPPAPMVEGEIAAQDVQRNPEHTYRAKLREWINNEQPIQPLLLTTSRDGKAATQ